MKNEELNYLGRPYTNCIKNETYSARLYRTGLWRTADSPPLTFNNRQGIDITYKASICQVNELLREINSVCGCVPSYMATVKDFPWIAHAKECTFGKHAGCVALIKVLVVSISGHVRHGRGRA